MLDFHSCHRKNWWAYWHLCVPHWQTLVKGSCDNPEDIWPICLGRCMYWQTGQKIQETLNNIQRHFWTVKISKYTAWIWDYVYWLVYWDVTMKGLWIFRDDRKNELVEEDLIHTTADQHSTHTMRLIPLLSLPHQTCSTESPNPFEQIFRVHGAGLAAAGERRGKLHCVSLLCECNGSTGYNE